LTGGSDQDWNDFSVQWDGYVTIPRDNTRLFTRSDDGSRMWIDVNGNGQFEDTPEEFVNNNWGNWQGTTTGPASVPLPAGTYAIRVQYEDGWGGNHAFLVWDAPIDVFPGSGTAHGPVVADLNVQPGSVVATAPAGIDVVLSGAVDPTTLTPQSFRVRYSSDSIFFNADDSYLTEQDGQIAWDARLRRASFVPGAPLRNGYYLVELEGDAGGIADLGGNLLDGEYRDSFIAGNTAYSLWPDAPSGDGLPGGDYRAMFVLNALRSIGDRMPPEFLEPPAELVAEATDSAGASVSYPLPAVQDDVDPSPIVACTPASGSLFALGTTAVTCTASDSAGNSSTLTFPIHIVDTTPPVLLNLPPDQSVSATSLDGAVVQFAPPTAYDSVDPNPDVECTEESGDVFDLGETEVTCWATDESGNFSAARFIVTVLPDDGPPTVERLELVTVGRRIAAMRLTFSEELDVATVLDWTNYRLVDPGLDLRFGTGDDRTIQWRSVVSDTDRQGVILTPRRPLRPYRLYEVVVTGGGGLRDTAGNELDGNRDGEPGGDFIVRFGRGPKLRYVDRDGDLVTLSLANGGALELLTSADGDARHLRLVDTVGNRSTLSGIVRKLTPSSDGMAQIELVSGLASVQDKLSSNLAFQIGQISPVAIDLLLETELLLRRDGNGRPGMLSY
jgi:hypothetical protein